MYNKADFEQDVAELFYTLQLFLYPNYPKTKFSPKEEVMIKNFAKKQYNGGVGRDWLRDYMLFQYNYWYLLKTKRSISLGWIIGPKALERWTTKPEGWRRYISKKMQQHLSLRIVDKVTQEEPGKSRWAILNPSEEKEKKRLYNTEEGFVWCVNMTTLHNPQSELCKECKFNLSCTKLLIENYPYLAKKRGVTSD